MSLNKHQSQSQSNGSVISGRTPTRDSVLTPLRLTPRLPRTPHSRRRQLRSPLKSRRSRRRHHEDNTDDQNAKRTMTTTECLLAAGQPDDDVTPHSVTPRIDEERRESCASRHDVTILAPVMEGRDNHRLERELMKMSVSPALDLRAHAVFVTGAQNLEELRVRPQPADVRHRGMSFRHA